MKVFYQISFICILFFFSCAATQVSTQENEENKMVLKPNEEGEYDIIVLDSQYDVYLKTKPNLFYNLESEIHKPITL